MNRVSYTISCLGDQGVCLEMTGSQIEGDVYESVIKTKVYLEHHPFRGMRDIIIGYRSVAIIFDSFEMFMSGVESPSAFVREQLEHSFRAANTIVLNHHVQHHRIPVCYAPSFALDMETFALQKQLTPEDVIGLHTSSTYQVYLIGFLPGFPYLGFVDERIAIDRKRSPRQCVAAGSIGIAGRQTGIYPIDSPGGWQIIGRTPIKTFDPQASPPVILKPGDLVSFYAIDEHEFDHLQNSRT